MDWDLYTELRKDGQAEGAARRAAAASDFAPARGLALRHGLLLRRNTEAHYTLAAGTPGQYAWLWDIYPGKYRIKQSRHHPATPFLADLPLAWTLTDLVQAAIQVKEGIKITKGQ
jgi:hypothetical protein